MKKIIGKAWTHSQKGTIGVVVVRKEEDDKAKYKAFMGVVQGDDEEADIQHVVDYGSKIHFSLGIQMIELYGIWDMTLVDSKERTNLIETAIKNQVLLHS